MTMGPRKVRAMAPTIDRRAVPPRTRPRMLVFSALAVLWTRRGNMTVARGRTSHIKARERVPAPS
jgi:hypothetical protein